MCDAEMERMKEKKMKTMYIVQPGPGNEGQCENRRPLLSLEDLESEEPHAEAKISYQLDQIF